MERFQIILLLFISSSWLLTCENEKNDNVKRPATINKLTTDTTGLIGKSNGDDFYSEWLSLPFTGSGSNWWATIPLLSIPENLLENARLTVYMKKYGSVFRLNYAEQDSSVNYGIDHGLITISSNFNPEGVEFNYRLSTDGTFVSNNRLDLNYATAFK